MKTIAQQLKVKQFPFKIKDENNNQMYYENSNASWVKREFDENNNQIYFENSNGYWVKKEFDENNNQLYYEDSEAFWYKREFDENSNEIYHETSDGSIIDNRPKPMEEYTMEELTKIVGKEFKLVK